MTAALRQMLDDEIETSEQNLRLLTEDGGEVWVELGTRLIREDDGTPSYFVVQVVDISDRMRDARAARATCGHRPADRPAQPAGASGSARAGAGAMPPRRHQVGIVFIDLDHFKSLNDVFGHDAGDEVLRQLSAG